MRYFVCILLASFLSAGLYSQNTVRLDAVKSNSFGVAYALPKSVMEITIDYSKKTKTAGEFYKYAERYLSVTYPIIESSIEYSLDDLSAEVVGIPDKENMYQVEFRPNSATAFITLTQDGLICAINDTYTFPEKEQKQVAAVGTKDVNALRFLSEEILRAGSTAKQAELVAKQIYRLRESRNEILTGEADNMPPDGEAYRVVIEQLNEQEKALTEMFIGKETVEPMSKTIRVELTSQDVENSVVARFSKKIGVVGSNDLAGEPILFTLTAKNPVPQMPLTEKEMKDLEKKFAKGIVYNIPGKAAVQVAFKNKRYVNRECDVVQFGTKDVLDQKPFGDKNNPLKVVFYPELGAIKQTGSAR